MSEKQAKTRRLINEFINSYFALVDRAKKFEAYVLSLELENARLENELAKGEEGE